MWTVLDTVFLICVAMKCMQISTQGSLWVRKSNSHNRLLTSPTTSVHDGHQFPKGTAMKEKGTGHLKCDPDHKMLDIQNTLFKIVHLSRK